MEERLQKALEFANYRQTLNAHLHKSKIKAETLLMFSKNGGNFIINEQLICFLDYLIRNEYSEATLLDSNKAPIHIADVSAFLKEVTMRYFEVTNDYLNEYQTLRKSRSVRSILDIKDKE